MSYPFFPNGAGYAAYGQHQQLAYPQDFAQVGPSYGNGYGYHQPRPIQPPPTVNPQEAFRSFYQQQLVALTWNSRPIIQNLTILAQERRDRNDWASCNSVAMEIELAIDKAPPSAKLPLLYLIDSISKNVGAPYTSNYFPNMLAATFLRAYAAVDGVTKTKMEEMLGTWRTGGPGGTDLFANGVRETVERGIYGGGQQHTAQSEHYGQPELTQESVLDQLARALQAKRHILARDPQNPEAQLHSGVLQQIQRLLHTQALPLSDLESIAQQLATINASDAAPPFASGTSIAHQNFASPALHHQPLHSYVSARLDGAEVGSSGSHTPVPHPAPTPFTAAATIPSAKIDFGSLFKNLAAAGVISQTSTPNAYAGTPVGRGGGTPDGHLGREGSVASEGSARNVVGHTEEEVEEADGLAEYEDLILAMNVSLTLVDLDSSREFDPTTHLPNRCTQCSARFPAGKLGRTRLQAHLDWHFRRNRRERESEGRGGHRRWLPTAEFWINDILADSVRDDLVTTGNAIASGSGTTHLRTIDPNTSIASSGTDQAQSQTAQRTAELTSQWVVVPSDPTLAALPCPICKEKFASEYSEAEEEWIWKNATRVDAQVFHATCRADAVSSSVANRLLADKVKSKPSRAASPAGVGRAGVQGEEVGGGSGHESTTMATSNGTTTSTSTASTSSPLKPKRTSTVENDESTTSGPSASEVAERTIQVKQEMTDERTVTERRQRSPSTSPSEGLKRKAVEEVDVEKVVKKEK